MPQKFLFIFFLAVSLLAVCFFSYGQAYSSRKSQWKSEPHPASLGHRFCGELYQQMGSDLQRREATRLRRSLGRL